MVRKKHPPPKTICMVPWDTFWPYGVTVSQIREMIDIYFCEQNHILQNCCDCLFSMRVRRQCRLLSAQKRRLKRDANLLILCTFYASRHRQSNTVCVHSHGHSLCLIDDVDSHGGGGPRVVVSTAAFPARVRGSVPGLGGLKETKLFLPHPRVKVSIVGSLRDREVACSASDRQGPNFESCVWRTVSSQSSHHPQEVLLAQFSLYVHKGGLKPDSFHFISWEQNHISQNCCDCLFSMRVKRRLLPA